MFHAGYTELLVLTVLPISGFLAALYLGLALQSNSRRGEGQR